MTCPRSSAWGRTTGDLRERFNALFSRQAARAGQGAATSGRLRDISFSVAEGESFGIIGHNGSGKSTLLKLITGIYTPTKGTFKTRGRISALIEVGAGFHPDLTGRENVYLNGSVMGMKKREIDKKFDEIVAFSELEQFIDTPVKRYSSGMYMRLGLRRRRARRPGHRAGGRGAGRRRRVVPAKCMKRMQDLRREGQDHRLHLAQHGRGRRLCKRVMLLSHGEMLTIGEPKEVVTAYRTSLAADRERRRQSAAAPEQGRPRDIEILGVRLRDEAGRECDTVGMGASVRLECDYRANVPVENPAFGVTINRDDGLYIFGPNTVYDDVPVGPICSGKARSASHTTPCH